MRTPATTSVNSAAAGVAHANRLTANARASSVAVAISTVTKTSAAAASPAAMAMTPRTTLAHIRDGSRLSSHGHAGSRQLNTERVP